jgi:hypothetical protein
VADFGFDVAESDADRAESDKLVADPGELVGDAAELMAGPGGNVRGSSDYVAVSAKDVASSDEDVGVSDNLVGDADEIAGVSGGVHAVPVGGVCTSAKVLPDVGELVGDAGGDVDDALRDDFIRDRTVLDMNLSRLRQGLAILCALFCSLSSPRDLAWHTRCVGVASRVSLLDL